jgi:hypothetical protein
MTTGLLCSNLLPPVTATAPIGPLGTSQNLKQYPDAKSTDTNSLLNPVIVVILHALYRHPASG